MDRKEEQPVNSLREVYLHFLKPLLPYINTLRRSHLAESVVLTLALVFTLSVIWEDSVYPSSTNKDILISLSLPVVKMIVEADGPSDISWQTILQALRSDTRDNIMRGRSSRRASQTPAEVQVISLSQEMYRKLLVATAFEYPIQTMVLPSMYGPKSATSFGAHGDGIEAQAALSQLFFAADNKSVVKLIKPPLPITLSSNDVAILRPYIGYNVHATQCESTIEVTFEKKADGSIEAYVVEMIMLTDTNKIPNNPGRSGTITQIINMNLNSGEKRTFISGNSNELSLEARTLIRQLCQP